MAKIAQSKDIKNTLEINFNVKERYHYNMVDRFFKKTKEENIKKMVDIIEGNSHISLRLLDWFITRYTDKKKIWYYLDNKERFSVHISYKAQLKSYRKQYFDPFRRKNNSGNGKKFYYVYDKENNKSIFTTIGQLNFFRWALTYGVIEYVEKNYDFLLTAMSVSNKEDKRRKKRGCTVKKKDSVKIKKKGVNVKVKKRIENDRIKIVLSFD